MNTNRNKLRKRGRNSKNEVKVQLGDPLPLPYKLDTQYQDPIKLEEDEETAVDTKPMHIPKSFHHDTGFTSTSKSIPTIFNHRLSSNVDNHNYSKKELRPTHEIESIPRDDLHLINMKNKPRSVSSRKNQQSLNFSKPNIEDLISSIENNLNHLRSLLDEIDDDKTMLSVVQDIDHMLNSFLDSERRLRERQERIQLQQEERRLQQEETLRLQEQERFQNQERVKLRNQESLYSQDQEIYKPKDFEDRFYDVKEINDESAYQENNDNSNEISILDELERLQKLKEQIIKSKSNSHSPLFKPIKLFKNNLINFFHIISKYKLTSLSILTGIILISIISSIFNELNYEYCYYFC